MPTDKAPDAAKDPSIRSGLEGGSRLTAVRSLARRFLVAIWPYVLVIGAWQAWVTLGGVHRLVIPPPGAVAFDIWSAPGEYWSYGWRTVLEAAAGLAIGTAIGVAAAIAVWFSRVLRGLLTTSMILLDSAPIVATIPIMAKVLGYSATTVLATPAGGPDAPSRTVKRCPSGIPSRASMRASCPPPRIPTLTLAAGGWGRGRRFPPAKRERPASRSPVRTS